MKNINWKVRFKKKSFWVAIISAIALFINNITQAFGLDYSSQVEQGVSIVTSILTILAGVGVIVDPTTAKLGDTGIAQTYSKPRDENIDPVEYQKVVSDENNSEIVDGINGTEISQGDVRDEIELNNQTAEDTFSDADNEIFGDSAQPQDIGNDDEESFREKQADADIKGEEIKG
ncbi:phage holin [Staphylococcus ureilyticus]|uniref:phage holin n=1 Tax=Staphylococcus ureilyticus TaxID=94138 RepID=UPI0034DD179A